MMGSPREAAERPISTTPPKLKSEPAPQAPSISRHPRPQVLMGEVAAPIQKYAAGGSAEHFGQQRYLLRSFMQRRGLRPSDWARTAGIPSGELLGFLTGRSRIIPPASLEKLAAAACCDVKDFFK
jgi:hypothetical protein